MADLAGLRAAGSLGRCRHRRRGRFLPPQRIEFRRSARTIDEYGQMSEMFDALYPDAAIPKGAWPWMESAQYRLLRHGAQHDLVVLHDDNDFATAARYLPDVRERTICDTPQVD